MTSQFKVQGSIKGLLLAVAAVTITVSSFQASAQTGPRGTGPRGTPPAPRKVIREAPAPTIGVPPCKRGGPGITPC